MESRRLNLGGITFNQILTLEEVGRIVVPLMPKQPSPTFRKAQWAMFGCASLVGHPFSASTRRQFKYSYHSKIILLTCVGMLARLVRGALWVYAKDDSGLVRPNGAVLTQIYLVSGVLTIERGTRG